MNLNDEKLYCEHLDTLRLFIRFLLRTGFFLFDRLVLILFFEKNSPSVQHTPPFFTSPHFLALFPPPPSNEIKRTGFAELVFIRVNKSFCWAGYGAGGNQTFFRSAPRPPGKQSQSFTI